MPTEMLKFLLNKLFLADKWNIGVVDQSVGNLIEKKELNAIEWLKEDRADYAADPFIVNVGDQIKIYYEELNFWHGRGEIMVMENLDFKTKNKVGGIRPSSIHLSYPYLIVKEQYLYCIPETSKAKEVVLYQVDALNPAQLIQRKVLLSGMPFVDSSIVFYAAKYWLFTSISGNSKQLYIFSSTTLDGHYKAHPLNPIAVEKQACRSAGSIFVWEGSIYRPTQNPVNCYGGSIQINKITVLTESEYKAESVFEIFPDKNYPRGIHHISFAHNKIVVDGKRKVFDLLMPLKKLVKIIRITLQA